MYLSLQFVREYVKLPDVSAKDVALALTMATVEVEEVIDQAADLSGVVVGRVVEIVKHPQADRLWVCRVDVKTSELQIICGGSNLSKNMHVAVALVGSKVRWHGKGEPISLEKAKIRGLESSGMIAASAELGLQELFPAASEHEIMDLTPYRLRVGDQLAQALGLTDMIFVIDNKSMTHRPDLWGQYGLAREVAALYQTRLKPLKRMPIPPVAPPTQHLTVNVVDQGLCPRYAAIVLDDVSAEASPWWLRRELSAAGIRPINRVVDVTNYVMIALGQPLHAFDYNALDKQTIRVEPAAVGTSLAALNGVTYTVPENTLVIADGTKAIAIAGIIGGVGSAVTNKTKTIVIEAANFSASSVRRSSLALGLRTEASSRFEKKLDPQLTTDALSMAVELILSVCPGSRVASPVVDVAGGLPPSPVIEITQDFLNRRLGAVLDPKTVQALLKRLEFGVTHKRGVYTIHVPSFRGRDVTVPVEVVEEVARLYGYNKIQPSLPEVLIAEPAKNPALAVQREVRNVLTRSFGYDELYTYSFANPEWSETLEHTRSRVAVANPLTPEQRYLRTSLLPGLLSKTVENLRWFPEFKIFEIGRVFSKAGGEFAVDATQKKYLPNQPIILAGVSVAPLEKAARIYRDVKGELSALLSALRIGVEFKEVQKHPFASSCFELRSGGISLGTFGLLRPDKAGKDLARSAVVWWKLKFSDLVKFADFSRQYESLPKFPSIVRDVAILVDSGVMWGEIEDSIKDSSPLLRSIEFFDVFSSEKLGENKKSVAFRLTFASPDRTLESKEAEAVVQKIQKILEKKFNAQIR